MKFLSEARICDLQPGDFFWWFAQPDDHFLLLGIHQHCISADAEVVLDLTLLTRNGAVGHTYRNASLSGVAPFIGYLRNAK